jgi:hypothetical protein
MALLVGENILVRVGQKGTLLCTVMQTDALCRSCGAAIIWVKTPKNRNMPIIEPEEGMPAETHFADCPQSKKWSGKGKQTKGGTDNGVQVPG